MPRYFIEVQYDGTAFHGSQIQGGQATVQLSLNKALSIVLREPITTLGASRTDEGVHALCNFYHFDWELELSQSFVYSLNALLPQSMAIVGFFRSLRPNANARFDAVARAYRYRIYKQKNPFLFQRAFLFPYTIDRAILDDTAALLMQYHNFETFSKRNGQNKTFNCTLFQSEWQDHGEELHYVVRGNRFLRGMVRALVGTQLRVARGKMTVQAFQKAIESKDCAQADFSVPGYGLYLEKVQYPDDLLLRV